MTFTAKKIPTQTLGEYLKDKRERLNYSFAEAARFSRIQPKYLRALEEGRFADLPEAVYVKGFLKSLGKIYRLEEKPLLQKFREEQEIAKNLQILGTPPEKKFPFPRLGLNPKFVVFSILILVGTMSLGYLIFQVSSLKRSPFLEIFSPAKDEVISTSLLLVRGQAEKGAVVYLNNQEIATDSSGEFRETVSLAPGLNLLTVKAVNKFQRESAITRSIVLAEKELAGSMTPLDAEIGSLFLTIEISIGPESAWISLKADGKQNYEGLMLPGTNYSINAQKQIILTTGNAGSTQVKLNGKDLGILGKEGEAIRDIEFTP